jgi:hypothetical protein
MVLEIRYKKSKFLLASIYFDINLSIEDDIRKVEKISAHTSKGGLIIAADSNARSKMWFDITTNQRGELLEDFIITNNLFIINEDTGIPTFETSRGRSNIDFTISSQQMVQYMAEWICGEVESFSDHKYIIQSQN